MAPQVGVGFLPSSPVSEASTMMLLARAAPNLAQVVGREGAALAHHHPRGEHVAHAVAHRVLDLFLVREGQDDDRRILHVELASRGSRRMVKTFSENPRMRGARGR